MNNLTRLTIVLSDPEKGVDIMRTYQQAGESLKDVLKREGLNKKQVLITFAGHPPTIDEYARLDHPEHPWMNEQTRKDFEEWAEAYQFNLNKNPAFKHENPYRAIAVFKMYFAWCASRSKYTQELNQ